MTHNDLLETQALYGQYSGLYDRLATMPGVRAWRERAAQSLSLGSGATVLEMGCGTGANLEHLRARVGQDGRVIGVDLTAAMLEAARRRVDRRGWDNVYLLQGDVTQLPIDTTVDAILATFVLGMVAEPERTIEDWLTHLLPGGRIASLEAMSTERPFARALNLPFSVCVGLTSPGRGWTLDAVDRLERRVRGAHSTIEDRTVDVTTETAGLGFVRLISGASPE